MDLGNSEWLFDDEWSIGDTHRQVLAVRPLLNFHHSAMDVRNNRMGARDIVMQLGNNVVGVCDTVMNVGNDGMGADKVMLNIGDYGVGG